MSQPRDREVQCGGCARTTWNLDRYCDSCSTHAGECHACQQLVERTYRILLPIEGGEWDEVRYCVPCRDEKKAVAKGDMQLALERAASDARMWEQLGRETVA